MTQYGSHFTSDFLIDRQHIYAMHADTKAWSIRFFDFNFLVSKSVCFWNEVEIIIQLTIWLKFISIFPAFVKERRERKTNENYGQIAIVFKRFESSASGKVRIFSVIYFQNTMILSNTHNKTKQSTHGLTPDHWFLIRYKYTHQWDNKQTND